MPVYIVNPPDYEVCLDYYLLKKFPLSQSVELAHTKCIFIRGLKLRREDPVGRISGIRIHMARELEDVVVSFMPLCGI